MKHRRTTRVSGYLKCGERATLALLTFLNIPRFRGGCSQLITWKYRKENLPMNQIARAMKIGKSLETAGDLIDQGRCPVCGEPVTPTPGFRDELSIQEFKISGMCQGCQDEIFGR
jgi:hypothetical protein